ncbi:MAG: pantetheine-phosphate adenylyltransferase [Nitrospirae bacterium]|nr:pantetheine-phosphate adenylyltransferase [Nitrospirota bacterium]
MTVTAIYPGTFDPITNGHIDIIIRSLKSFDHIIVGIGPNPKKTTLFSLEERISMVKECLGSTPNVSVKTFDGLLVDFAKKQNATVIIRGLRAISDFEYEFQMALMNRKLDSDIETVFLMPSEEYSYLTSSIIKVVASFGGDISSLVPSVANDMLKLKFKK